jgi:hypothetical protein
MSTAYPIIIRERPANLRFRGCKRNRYPLRDLQVYEGFDVPVSETDRVRSAAASVAKEQGVMFQSFRVGEDILHVKRIA